MKALLQKAFYGRRVLVTGDTGFKGSWLTLWLHELGADVTGFALPPIGERSHFRLLGLDKKIRHVDGDIRDGEALLKVFSDVAPEVVIHMAAQAIVRISFQDPKTTFDTNVGGGVNLLEAVRNSPSVAACVFITSDKCYFNQEWVWGYRENDRLGGRDPYSASKAAAEIVYAAYLDSYFGRDGSPGIASTRAGNVIGGGDWADSRIIPDCIRALEAGRSIELRSPNATRPWQHVLEPLSGYLMLAARLLEDPKRYSGSWNFGPDTRSVFTVGELARRVVKVWGSGEVVEQIEENAPHEANLLQLNTDKARIELGWSSLWDGGPTIQATVDWYRRIYDGESTWSVSMEQIRAYMDTER